LDLQARRQKRALRSVALKLSRQENRRADDKQDPKNEYEDRLAEPPRTERPAQAAPSA
jgi:hypothetical protein